MFGHYRHTLDPKGRLFVPAKLREELGESFYVTFAPDRCLTVYTEAGWQVIVDRFNSLPVSSTTDMRILFANAAKCEPDKQGRFLLPAELRDYAGIKQDVTFVGLAGRAEIWATEEYNARYESSKIDSKDVAAVMAQLGF